MFVFNDPIGKESFDEMLYNAWGHYRETLGLLLKHAKLLLTCRKSVFSDERAKRLFTKEGKTIDICLLYTSDAADDMQCVDLGGRRIIKKTDSAKT